MKTILALLLLSSASVAQSWYQRIERVLTDFNTHIAKVLEQQAFAKRARFVAVREREARRTITRGQARARKLTRRVDGWRKDARQLQDRLRDLQRKTRAVRNSTMRRRYGSLEADVQRKIDQRQEWIDRAGKELDEITQDSLEAQKILVECAQIRDRIAREAAIQG